MPGEADKEAVMAGRKTVESMKAVSHSLELHSPATNENISCNVVDVDDRLSVCWKHYRYTVRRQPGWRNIQRSVGWLGGR